MPIARLVGRDAGQRAAEAGSAGLNVELTGGGIALIGALTALLGVLPGVVTALVDWKLKPAAQAASIQVERAKVELERRKADTDLYKAVLAEPDPARRHKRLQFLMTAGLLQQNDAVARMKPEEIPEWPLPTPPSK